MIIVVLGAGTVGTSIANTLCRHGHSVTVVDQDPEQTRRVNDELDVRVVTGSASQSSVLFQTDVFGADLCLAVTGCDEVNLIGASMAKGMGARRAVARVYAPVFRDLSTFDYQSHFKIDRLVSIEHLSAMELARAIRHPGAVAVENFARGELEMQEIEVTAATAALEKPLKELKLPAGVRIGSIYRAGKLKIAGAEDRVQVGDHITLLGRREEIDQVRELFEVQQPPKQDVVIAGGGETGYHLARVLEGPRFRVLLLERDRRRCEFLAQSLKHATVVNADAHVACTGDDEDSIMACVEARELGAKTIMCIVSRPDYANVVAKLGIDYTVSPRKVIAREVLGYLNTGPVVSRVPLVAGMSVEIMEILPRQCLFGAVIRKNYVVLPGADDRLQPGDRVVVLVETPAVEQMLEVFSTSEA